MRPTEGQREHANEARAAVARPARLHLSEELGDAIGRGGVRTSVAGRIHAGFAAESVDDEAGIVGEHGKGGKAAVVQGLAGGVLGKGGRGFLEWRERGKIWQKLEIERDRVPAPSRRGREIRSTCPDWKTRETDEGARRDRSR